ncbi:hypothetical protein EII18_11590 [Comamonadaceae bacterium OH3737_COT-264]|nr:hypothetical protein EII18_11590 [Comamonadaceae bacterium OH3737_COT-264]
MRFCSLLIYKKSIFLMPGKRLKLRARLGLFLLAKACEILLRLRIAALELRLVLGWGHPAVLHRPLLLLLELGQGRFVTAQLRHRLPAAAKARNILGLRASRSQGAETAKATQHPSKAQHKRISSTAKQRNPRKSLTKAGESAQPWCAHCGWPCIFL